MSLVKIAPLDPPVVLPLGDDGRPATQIGVSPRGVPYYSMKRIRAGKHEPRLGENGKQMVVKHETTGVEMYKKWKRGTVTTDHVFTLESDGHGTLYIEPYQEPSPEELARVETERRATVFKDDLARLAAERGISAESLLSRLMDEADDESVKTYPIEAPGVGRWFLSNGSKMQGSRADAEAAEAALHASV